MGIYGTLVNLARAAQARGELARAARLFAEALPLTVAVRDVGNIAFCLEGLADVAGAQGRPGRAARLFGAAAALLGAHEAPVFAHDPEPTLAQRRLAAARGTLDEGTWATAWAAGHALSPEAAIAEALAGAVPAPPALGAGAPADGPAPTALSAREREVAALVARGRTNAQIAAALGIAPRTADAHVRNILRKLGVASRAAVADRLSGTPAATPPAADRV